MFRIAPIYFLLVLYGLWLSLLKNISLSSFDSNFLGGSLLDLLELLVLVEDLLVDL